MASSATPIGFGVFVLVNVVPLLFFAVIKPIEFTALVVWLNYAFLHN